MGRFWYIGVEEKNVKTVKRVLNCDGVYHWIGPIGASRRLAV